MFRRQTCHNIQARHHTFVGIGGIFILIVTFLCFFFGVKSSDEFSSIDFPLRSETLETVKSMTRPVVLLLPCYDEVCVSDLFSKLDLNAYCRDLPFPVDVILGLKHLRKVTISLPDCRNIFFIKDPPLPEGMHRGAGTSTESMEDIARRVERISFIREFFRDQITLIYSKESSKPSHLILMDPDMYKLVYPNTLLNAIATVQSGKWQVVCANGFMFLSRYNGRIFYDTYALLQTTDVEDDDHLFGDINPRKYYQELTSSDIVEVKSCFGGASVYEFDMYITPECHYYSETENFRVCEHRRFLKCLREKKGAKVGIDGEFMLQFIGPYTMQFYTYMITSTLFYVRFPMLLIGCGAIFYAARKGIYTRRYLPVNKGGQHL